MSELSKQALKVDNNQSFPNNNAGLITPTALRTFNENMIDSLVDELSYNVDSGSWNQQINALEQFTASASGLSTGSLLVTASAVSNVMTFTKGDNSTFNVTVGSVIPSGTISSSQQISGLGFVSSSVTGSSLVTASFASQNLTFTKGDGSQFSLFIPDNSGSVLPSGVVSGSAQISGLGFQTTASFNTYTSSNDSKVNSLINATSSYAISSSVAAVDAGQQLQINSLIAATSSYATSAITASSLITASFSGNTLTFTKGNGTTFGVVIPDVSGSVIPAGTISGSSQVDYPFISNIPAGIISSSQQLPSGLVSGSTQIIELGFQTTSSFNAYTASQSTGSLLLTASFSGNTLTFTKADTTTFGVVIPDVSGSVIPAGTVSSSAQIVAYNIFATTGSNTFIGNQALTGSLFISGNINMVNGADIVTHHVRAQGSNGLELQTSAGTIIVSMGAGGGTQATFVGAVSANSISASTINGLGDPLAFSTSVDSRLDGLEATTASLNTSVTNLNSSTASLFTSASLALVTASFSGNTLTFTKGNGTTFGVVIPDVSGSTINTGSFATTGSNTFNGNQVITGSVDVLGLSKQTLGAAGTESQKDIIVVTGSVIDGKAYDLVTFGLQDYPSSGDALKDAFAIDYYSSGYAFGAGFTHNGIRTGTELLASGSGNSFGGTGYGISQLRALGNKSFLNQYASIINIGVYAPSTTDSITIGHSTLPILSLASLRNEISGSTIISGSSGLQVTGSVGITGTLTASLQQGYVWVGDANGRTITVSTGSFGGGGSAFPFTGNAQISGSLGVTGSMSGFVNTLSVASSTASVNFNDGNMFTITLPTGSVTHITPTNIRRGQTCNIQISQASSATTGSVTFSPNVLFAGGNDYQVTATGSAIDLLTFVSLDGTNVLGTSIKNFL